MKVLPFQIPKPLHENLIVQEDRVPTFYGQLHQHKELQLSLIVKGKGKLIVGDSVHPFEDGDFFAIPPHSPHLFSNDPSPQGVHMISLFFTEKTFGKGFFELPVLEEVYPFFNMALEGFRLTGNKKVIAALMLRILKSEKLERLMNFLLLLKKVVPSEKQALTQFLYPKEITIREGKRMQLIFDYTIKNFQHDITLQEAAGLVHMTPNAFCRYFKQRTNKTYFQFLIELRIEHACQLLVKDEEELSVLEISERSGFSSISNFNRQFRKLKGMVPSKYTNQYAFK
ncbi:transcriptional regulator, AraC family [Pricia antarctica]|uniref:Transcriptional regulator, AraC family n=1 Tax=Pricia antarctica TaxID=641691 RepID=A0A1G7FFL9_9FLAO|nr:AraC family transcriptional regulator [Pricia antarctica]SDE74365.1 transcriptional regulator, AraC family [Pricia antarctica]